MIPGMPYMAYGIITPMPASLEKTTVYLDAETRRGLRALSRSTGRPQAELIREALDAYLDRSPRQTLPAWIGAWKNGPATDAGDVKRLARDGWTEEGRVDR
jgi:predicted transcriptional regulator